MRRKASSRRRARRIPRPSPSMTRWPARSSMAAARRLPASRPSPAMSVRSRLRWARTPTRRSAANAPRRWQGSEVAAERSRRCRQVRECLADHVTAPAELLRRLRQVAVVDEDRGQALAVGQRLVTRDGRLRRWDGFVAAGAGAAAAERLLRANRLAELAAELAGARTARSRMRWRNAMARLAAMEQCRRAAEAARTAALAAERDARDAARAIDVAAAALERIEAQRDGFAQRRADLEPGARGGRAKRLPRPSSRLRPCPIRRRSSSTSKVRAGRGNGGIGGRRQARRSGDQGARNRRRPRTIERRGARAGRMAHARRRGRAATAQAIERQKQLAAERAELEASRPSSTRRSRELERANNESQAQIGEAAAAEREAEEAVAAAAQDVAAANERSADTRERRAAAAARAEAQQARSAEFARACGRQVRMRAAAAAGEARVRRGRAARCRRGSGDARAADRRARADRAGQSRRGSRAGRARAKPGQRAPRKRKS